MLKLLLAEIPTMHFDLTITLGNLMTLVALLAVAFRIERAYNLYAIEHEMLMTDYCEQRGIRLRDLPTRSRERKAVG